MQLMFTILNFPPSNFGGQASCMYPVIKELSKTFNIKVLTTNYKIPSELNIITNKWTNYDGIKVKYISIKHKIFSLKYITAGLSELKKNDQIHLNGIFFFPNFIFLLKGIALKKTIFVSPHGELSYFALKSKSWKKTPYLTIFKFFSKKIIFRATSDEEALQIKRHFPKSNISIIPNFFKLNSYLNLPKQKQFLFLGRISKIKRIENLIFACSINRLFLSKNYKFLIAGPSEIQFSEYEKYLKELVKSNNLIDRIMFIGEINSPNKENIIAQSKALFLVSDSENFGNVVVESLAQGTPVVASKGTPWEVLNKRNAGFWVENSPKSISEIIDYLISMSTCNYNKMCGNAMILSKDYTLEKVLPLWTETINHFQY